MSNEPTLLTKLSSIQQIKDQLADTACIHTQQPFENYSTIIAKHYQAELQNIENEVSLGFINVTGDFQELSFSGSSWTLTDKITPVDSVHLYAYSTTKPEVETIHSSKPIAEKLIAINTTKQNIKNLYSIADNVPFRAYVNYMTTNDTLLLGNINETYQFQPLAFLKRNGQACQTPQEAVFYQLGKNANPGPAVNQRLTFTTNSENSKISLTGIKAPDYVDETKKPNIYYKTDDMPVFLPYTDGLEIVLKSCGDTVSFYNKTTILSYYATDPARFHITGDVGCSGSLLSLVGNPTTSTSVCFTRLFQGCTGLTTPPELPATTLADSCYYAMFQGCTKLRTIMKLLTSNTKAAPYCCACMFKNCTSLQAAVFVEGSFGHSGTYTIVDLYVSNEYEGMCANMFQGCTGMLGTPLLHLRTPMRAYSASQMFMDCISLKAIYIDKLGEYGWDTYDTDGNAVSVVGTNAWFQNIPENGKLTLRLSGDETPIYGDSYIPPWSKQNVYGNGSYVPTATDSYRQYFKNYEGIDIGDDEFFER
jgi:hypothetical protein